MTIEEFFKKKRIDLAALGKAEPALFSEFKTHFEQMGEKSFDHTKKYWFNKLRHQYHLPPEVKTEKPHIANPIAEQTITESLIENTPAAAPTAKPGFTPRFKAVNIAKPTMTEAKTDETTLAPVKQNIESEKPVSDTPVTAPAPKPGFTPRFKAANVAKPVAENKPEQDLAAPIEENKVEEKPAEVATPPSPKLGFTPKFRAGNMPKPAVIEEQKEVTPPVIEDEKPQEENAAPDSVPAKPVYKPRFNMRNMPPKTES